ncbi:MAG: polyprenyl synthetase family protein, partial [archaeon]
DNFLQTTEKVGEHLLNKYNLMIRLFTGRHIKGGFLLGYLISGKNPVYGKKVAEIGEQIGAIRQIKDDLDDYEEKHHEPLGDLINHKKRLPEILFLLSSSGWEKNELELLLKNPLENAPRIKALVLNEKVGQRIESEIQNISKNVEAGLTGLPDGHKVGLTNLLRDFLPLGQLNHSENE